MPLTMATAMIGTSALRSIMSVSRSGDRRKAEIEKKNEIGDAQRHQPQDAEYENDGHGQHLRRDQPHELGDGVGDVLEEAPDVIVPVLRHEEAEHQPSEHGVHERGED